MRADSPTGRVIGALARTGREHVRPTLSYRVARASTAGRIIAAIARGTYASEEEVVTVDVIRTDSGDTALQRPRPLNLRHAELAETTMPGRDLRDVDMNKALLRGALMTRVDLRGADLRGADLRGADLTGADLTGADLRGADLTGADLFRVDLTAANMRKADLTGAKLSEVIWSEDTVWPQAVAKGIKESSSQVSAGTFQVSSPPA
jgi:Pentapeptide repeats (8 copies)